jgi:dolichol-phosphate mannosyltransferase
VDQLSDAKPGRNGDDEPRRPALSIVIPTYFEEDAIRRCVAETDAALQELGLNYEIVFVDDGSQDRTVEILSAAVASNPRLRVVELSRNHGKPYALTAGIAYARGERILLMDPDLQESPAEIRRFVAKLDEGFDVVYGVRDRKQDAWTNVVFSAFFWWLLRKLTRLNIPSGLSVMRIFNRPFRTRFLQYQETFRFVEGIMFHIGMRQATLMVKQYPRIEGETKFSFSRRLQLALSAIMDYSNIPLVLAIRCGLLLMGLGFVSAFALVIARLFFMEFQLGWPSLIVTMITGFGLQILVTGIVGLYVGRTFLEAKRRPVFSVRRVIETVNSASPCDQLADDDPECAALGQFNEAGSRGGWS